MKANAEEIMSARENNMETEQLLTMEESGWVKFREKNLKEKENDFEVKKAYGEEVMLHQSTNLRSAELAQLEETVFVDKTRCQL